MSDCGDDIDDDIRTLVAESMDLADEYIAVTVLEELVKTKNSVLKDLESDLEIYARQISNYTNRLQRLELLEQGVLHRLNACSALTKEFDQLTDIYEAKVAQLKVLLDKGITFECSKLLAKDVFQKLHGFSSELDCLQQKLESTTDLINKNENQGVVQTLTHLKRKTSKVMQDMESFLGLNSMHKQTVIGFSNRIYYDEQKMDAMM
ncbi:uncharacterized protein LOC131436877 [Malaya genurostris]|uniref:uncharacterized protein LOC131436877 n=1 Tax=Malaya genurostris TaxID=325434 RepID=UPI0026F3DD2D|nr:uncharacterized protein LOC131436877 [Malaya genurostris]XP_058461826.1 uncharacterized protein LOC131436877 [Malaya genurostris]